MTVYWPRTEQIKRNAREMMAHLKCEDLTSDVYELIDVMRENIYGAPRTNAAAMIYIAAKNRGFEIPYTHFRDRFRCSHSAVAGMVKYICERRSQLKGKPGSSGNTEKESTPSSEKEGSTSATAKRSSGASQEA